MQQEKKIFFAALLIFLGIMLRTAWHLGPNVEFITSATLLAAAYLGKRWAILIPLIIMVITDLMIGNTSIFIFTWSAYIMIGIGGYYIQKFKVQSSKFKVMRATLLGILASFWFYLWTNLGVWLLDSWGMYPKTIFGLLDAYIFALPFLKYNLISNLIFVPVSFFLVEVGKNLNLTFIYANTKLIIKHHKGL